MNSIDRSPDFSMRNALRAVLLFFNPAPWSADQRAEWKRVTGEREATTRVMCDHIRKALMVGSVGDSEETFRLWALKPGDVLTEQNIKDIHDVIHTETDEIEQSAEAYHQGRTDTLREIGGDELVALAERADNIAFANVVKKAMARFRHKLQVAQSTTPVDPGQDTKDEEGKR